MEHNYRQVSISFDDQTIHRLKVIADDRSLGMSGVLRSIVKEAFDELQVTKKELSRT
jgi:hypothetical protein